MSEAIKMRECPNRKCGGSEPVVDQHPQILTSKAVRVVCLGCLTSGPLRNTEAEAVDLWNELPRDAEAMAGVVARVVDPFVSDLRFHPSDWERGAEGRDKLRERREEIVRAFDSAMAHFGRDRSHVADRLVYIAAAVLSVGEGLGLDVSDIHRQEVARG